MKRRGKAIGWPMMEEGERIWLANNENGGEDVVGQ
jgi:hypothetical protein